MTWQKIESAPRDGTRVLLHERDAPEPIFVGFFHVEWWEACESDPYAHQPDSWMPLPPPPEDGEQGW
jgi:hypothetical protein